MLRGYPKPEFESEEIHVIQRPDENHAIVEKETKHDVAVFPMDLLPIYGCKLLSRTLELCAQPIDVHERNPVESREIGLVHSEKKESELDSDAVTEEHIKYPLVPPTLCKIWNKIRRCDFYNLPRDTNHPTQQSVSHDD